MVTEAQIREALQKVEDPELRINVVDLGLIYGINFDGQNNEKVHITMTLTTPTCPHGQQLVNEVKETVKRLPGVEGVEMKVTFTPFWTPDRISEKMKMILRASGYPV